MNQFFTRSIVFMLFLLFGSVGFGQRCLSSIKRAQALENNPHLAAQLQVQDAATQRWITANQSSARHRSVVTVPVVVHVIWKKSQENISTQQIMSQFDVLNKDFRKLNANFNTGPTAFQPLGADVGIEFCLASVDPSGNPTNGITRKQTTIDNIGMTNDWYRSARGGQDAWDVDRYINIWVCNLGDDGTLGFATIPGSADPPKSDGLVIGYQFFGLTTNSQPNHLGRTTTHEMGHYFNLEHVWGPDKGGCNEDDFVNDTPNQETETSECGTFPEYDACTNSGNGIMYNNYMDYVDDACMTMFTQGQKMRMLAALNGPRASLLASNGCGMMTAATEITVLKPTIFPNPVNDQLTISFPEGILHNEVFSIFSLTGEKILEFRAEKNLQIDLEGIPEGIYFLISSNRTIGAQKFIISK